MSVTHHILLPLYFSPLFLSAMLVVEEEGVGGTQLRGAI